MSNLMKFFMTVVALALLVTVNANAFAGRRATAEKRAPTFRTHNAV